jgi:Right handed beta helix region
MKARYELLLAVLVALLFTATAQADTLTVNCRKHGDGLRTISAAVAVLTQKAAHMPLGSNTITVNGSCVENVSILSLDNLTLQAGPSGASITDASNGTLDTVVVGDSNRFALNGFTINGSVNCVDNSVCRLSGNTIQNSQTGYGLRGAHARIVSQGDNIINNPSGVGVVVTNQSGVVLVDDTISNNSGHGVQVSAASFAQITAFTSATTISNNGGHGIFAADNGTVRLQFANVTGNASDGIRVQNESVLRADAEGPSVNNITGNGGAGVNLGDTSHASFPGDGSLNIIGNLGGIDVYCAGQFATTRNVAVIGGTTNCAEPNPN